MTLSSQDKLLLEMQVNNEGPNLTVAYLLWFAFGFFSAHRFYLGKTGSAILQVFLNFLVIGLIWTLIDVFLIKGMAREKREALRQKYTIQALTQVTGAQTGALAAAT